MLYSEIERTEQDELWPGVVLAEDVTQWVGPEKSGKGLTYDDLTARITRGWPMAPTLINDPLIDWDAVNGPGYVIIISYEDRAESTQIDRLTAAGADLRYVDDGTHLGKDGGRFDIATDMARLRARVAYLNNPDNDDVLPGGVRLVIIDPLMAASSQTVSYNQKVRKLLVEPLQEFCYDTGAGVLLINHFFRGAKKGNWADHIYGSRAIMQALRLTVMITEDETNPEIRCVQTLATNGEPNDEPLRYIIKADGPNTRIMWQQPPPRPGDVDAKARITAALLRELESASRPVTAHELAQHTNLKFSLVKQILGAAMKEGLVVRRRGAFELPQPIEAPEPEVYGELTEEKPWWQQNRVEPSWVARP